MKLCVVSSFHIEQFSELAECSKCQIFNHFNLPVLWRSDDLEFEFMYLQRHFKYWPKWRITYHSNGNILLLLIDSQFELWALIKSLNRQSLCTGWNSCQALPGPRSTLYWDRLFPVHYILVYLACALLNCLCLLGIKVVFFCSMS